MELEAAGVCVVTATDEEEGGGDDEAAAAPPAGEEEVLQGTSAAAASSSPTDDRSQPSPFTAVLLSSLPAGCGGGVAFGLGVWCEGEESLSPLRRGEGLSSLLADEVGGASFSSPSEPFTALL